jgi:single-strand DNA-binding protein
MNLNKAILIGRLTADPQLRSTAAGQAVATFSIATNREWTNKQGERQRDVQFHNVVVWGRQAEITSQFLKKGSLAMVEGHIQNRSWQDKQGQKRTTTEIVCDSIQFGPRGGEGGAPHAASNTSVSQEMLNTKEELPEIHIDDGEEIQPENIPF